MRILYVSGNHLRHLYYINTIQEKYDISGGIVSIRESMVPQPPQGISETDRKNFVRHFENRDVAEKKHFGKQHLPDCQLRKIEDGGLNTKESAEFVKSIDPDVVLLFGCGLIKEPLYSALPSNTINLHGGLSPRYRGTATLFWPFYFMEPQYAGSTFHHIVSEPDAGDIIHQTVPVLQRDDRIHDVACKTLIESAKDAIKLLELFEENRCWQRHKQKGTGKNFLQTDFKPEHLRVIYNLFDDDMVNEYLDGKLGSKTPKLVTQFRKR